VNITELENAIRAWVLSTTGLDPSRVWFSDQPVPSPAISSSSPRITIGVSNSRKVGQDELRHTFDSSRPAGQEIEYQAIGPREVTVSLQAFAADGSSFELLETARTGLRLPSVRDALNAAGVGVLREGDVRSLFAVRGTTYEDRALLELVVLVSSSAVERLGYIDRVEVSYGVGPVFEQRGFEAPGFELERIASGSGVLPVLEPNGGVAFSRAGAIAGGVSGTQAVNAASLIAREVGRWPTAIARDTTLSVWFRRAPAIAVPGVATLSDRLCFVYAGKDRDPSPPVYLFLLWGLTYRPLTNELRFTTETPVSAVSSGVASRTTVLAGALPVGQWKHIAVTNAANGSISSETLGSTMRWYVDGVQVQEDVGTGAAGPCISRFDLQDLPTASIGIGGRFDRGLLVDGCDGAIRQAAIYGRALNATEVGALYRSGPFGLRP